ncbi:MAG: hypothetical protein Q8Q07_00060 [Dehalococcoidales bacterium]|nr:hypothetical protein [Dehalococcoidales bacterium]MDZ4230509.1 hypothetical protein [Dehalococcoidales bacterium]
MKGLIKVISVTGQMLGLIAGDEFVTPTYRVIAEYPNIQFDM